MEAGRDAAAEALTWAWRNWHRVRVMENSTGYLYRVGRTSAIRALGQEAKIADTDVEVEASAWELPNYEPNLASYLAGLSEQQRVSVWMVHGLGFTHTEVAEILNCSKPTVGTHVRRGLDRLRERMGVEHG